MNITDTIDHHNRVKFAILVDDTIKVEANLKKIISYLRQVEDSKAFDWQERGSIGRAIHIMAKVHGFLELRVSQCRRALEHRDATE